MNIMNIKPTNKLQNPFNQNEDWQSWFEGDKTYQLHQKYSFQKYQQKFTKHNIYNTFIPKSISMSFTQLTLWISKHAILATAIFLILTSTIGVFAAESLAPKEFKPSTIISNKQESSSSSSSSVSSSNSSQTSSSSVLSQLSQSSAQVSSPVSNLQTYTNPYFPDFKLVYPSDWKFETKTQSSNFENLLSREITLSKNGLNLSVSLFPKTPPQCGGGGYEVVSSQKFSNGVEKIFYKILNQDERGVEVGLSEKNYVKYGEMLGCIAGQIRTNIDINTSKNYKTESNNYNSSDKSIIYLFNITNDKEIEQGSLVEKELDQIISQSSFK